MRDRVGCLWPYEQKKKKNMYSSQPLRSTMSPCAHLSHFIPISATLFQRERAFVRLRSASARTTGCVLSVCTTHLLRHLTPIIIKHSPVHRSLSLSRQSSIFTFLSPLSYVNNSHPLAHFNLASPFCKMFVLRLSHLTKHSSSMFAFIPMPYCRMSLDHVLNGKTNRTSDSIFQRGYDPFFRGRPGFSLSLPFSLWVSYLNVDIQ